MACCDICGAVFSLTNNLIRHIVFSHNENDPAPIKNCDKCDYKGTFTNLMYHKKNTHREFNYKCSLCNEEAICNLLHRARVFTIRNGCQKLLSMFMEYENSLYQNK